MYMPQLSHMRAPGVISWVFMNICTLEPFRLKLMLRMTCYLRKLQDTKAGVILPSTRKTDTCNIYPRISGETQHTKTVGKDVLFNIGFFKTSTRIDTMTAPSLFPRWRSSWCAWTTAPAKNAPLHGVGSTRSLGRRGKHAFSSKSVM